jgi:hypothetical protein
MTPVHLELLTDLPTSRRREPGRRVPASADPWPRPAKAGRGGRMLGDWQAQRVVAVHGPSRITGIGPHAQGRRIALRAAREKRRPRLGNPRRRGPADNSLVTRYGLNHLSEGYPALQLASAVTCVDALGLGSPAPGWKRGRGLLMRLGFTPFRGSNPRASAAHRPLPPSTQGRGQTHDRAKLAVWVAVGVILGPAPWMQLAHAPVRDPFEQVHITTADSSGQPESCYRSAGRS